MNTISGAISFNGTRTLPKNAVVEVTVEDVSRMDAPSVTLGKQLIKNPKSFPIKYRLSYDPKSLVKEPYGRYGLRVVIKSGNKLIYLSDTFNSILNNQFKVLPSLNVKVIKV